MHRAIAAVLALGLAGAAAAEPIDSAAARKALFSSRTGEVVFAEDSGLSAADRKLLESLFKLSSRSVSPALLAAAGVSREEFEAALTQFRAARYYGAMAVSPARGMVSPATQMAQNLHSPEAARAAALAACGEAAGSACVIAAEVLPRRFKPAEFTLSQSATAEFAGYRRGAGPKSLAISASTPAFAIARGLGSGRAAIAECNRLAGTGDCAVAVADQ